MEHADLAAQDPRLVFSRTLAALPPSTGGSWSGSRSSPSKVASVGRPMQPPIVLSAGYLEASCGARGAAGSQLTTRDHRVAVGLGAARSRPLAWVRPVLSFGFGSCRCRLRSSPAAGLADAVCDLVLKVFGVTTARRHSRHLVDTIARSTARRAHAGRATHIPTVIWGGLWIVAALVVRWAGLAYLPALEAESLPAPSSVGGRDHDPLVCAAVPCSPSSCGRRPSRAGPAGRGSARRDRRSLGDRT